MANHLKARRKELGLTQQQVAEGAGTTKATIMKLEKGDMQLTAGWLERLAAPLQCSPQDLIAENWPEAVPIIGEIIAAGQVMLYPGAGIENGLAEHDKPAKAFATAPRPPDGEYRQMRALKVSDASLEPLLPAGSLVYYAEPQHSGFESLMQRLVVAQVQTKSGVELRVGRLRASADYGRFGLEQPSGNRQENLIFNWAAPVIFLKPSL